jgi:type I restriction enzyme R subunit
VAGIVAESVKAKLKVTVKRTLRQFGYPPDMQLLATAALHCQPVMQSVDMTSVVK